jgi:hypothetical protein
MQSYLNQRNIHIRDLFTTPKIQGKYCTKTSSVIGGTNELLSDIADCSINYDEYVTNKKKTISIVWRIATCVRGAHWILYMWKPQHVII